MIERYNRYAHESQEILQHMLACGAGKKKERKEMNKSAGERVVRHRLSTRANDSRQKGTVEDRER